MTPEQHLWQSVVLKACSDATHPAPGPYAKNYSEVMQAKREADKWLRGCGRDMRQVCALAGMDPDFVSEAYIGGRIDADLLRTSEDGVKKRKGRAA